MKDLRSIYIQTRNKNLLDMLLIFIYIDTKQKLMIKTVCICLLFF